MLVVLPREKRKACSADETTQRLLVGQERHLVRPGAASQCKTSAAIDLCCSIRIERPWP